MVPFPFQAKIPTESDFGMKVLISFGGFQTWNMGSNRNCALVSQSTGGSFDNANYYFTTGVYFMLSAVSTPKLAILFGERISWIVMLLSPDKSRYFMSIDTVQ